MSSRRVTTEFFFQLQFTSIRNVKTQRRIMTLKAHNFIFRAILWWNCFVRWADYEYFSLIVGFHLFYYIFFSNLAQRSVLLFNGRSCFSRNILSRVFWLARKCSALRNEICVFVKHLHLLIAPQNSFNSKLREIHIDEKFKKAFVADEFVHFMRNSVIGKKAVSIVNHLHSNV